MTKIKNDRTGEENYNTQKLKMKIIAFRRSDNIDIQFEDGYIVTNTTYTSFKKGNIRHKNYNILKYLNKTNINYQGCIMKIIKYNSSSDIEVEFQDEYKAIIKAEYHRFKTGRIRNPYFPSVYNKGIPGNKYTSHRKEYHTWHDMLRRCFDEKTKEAQPTYKSVTCCNDWLLFDNFYEWLHSQENFEKWYNGEKWAVDKDILVKGNKIYTPETCCLVPVCINNLFRDTSSYRGDLPLGITRIQNKEQYYEVNCNNKYLATSIDIKDAFDTYKEYKEKSIKCIAQEEFEKGNITKRCYDAMMSYEVEITD